MSEYNNKKIVEEWIIYYESEKKSKKNKYYPSVLKLHDLVQHQPLGAWHIILEILEQNPKQPLLTELAEGPMQDLVSFHAKDLIELILREARKNDKFNYLLGGVWNRDIPDDVWQRIEMVRSNVW